MTIQPRSLSKYPAAVILVLLAAVLFFNGCASSTTDEKAPLASAYLKTSSKKAEEIAKLNTTLLASARIDSDPSDYLLGAGDLIEMDVFEAKELHTTARVSSRGYVTLPLINEVKVKGLTASEAENFIEDLYRKKYIKNPHISIFIKEHFSQRITLVGQVKNPGTYDYMARQRLLDVLALAGGLTEKAGAVVQVRRYSGTHNERQMFMVDIDKLVREGNVDLNIKINGGDIIFVPEAGTFFADGAVRKPGSYPLKSKMNLQEALLESGGFASYADNKKVTLIRSDGKAGRKILHLDLEKRPKDQGLVVKDHDVIIAKESTWGKITHGTGFNIGIPGFLGIGYRDPSR